MEQYNLILILDKNITAVAAIERNRSDIITICGEESIPLRGEISIDEVVDNIKDYYNIPDFSGKCINTIIIKNRVSEKLSAYTFEKCAGSTDRNIVNMLTLAPMLVRNKGLDLPASISLNGIGYCVDDNGVALAENTDTATEITYDDLLFLFWVKPELLSSNYKELAEYKDKCNNQSKEIDRLNQEIEKLNKKLYPATSSKTDDKTTNENNACNKALQSYEINQSKVQVRFDNKSISVGDIIKFGTYRQSANMFERTSIEWQVLDINDGKALLISKYVLDAKPYFEHEQSRDHWENSNLREWLNCVFFNAAFNINEKDHIVALSHFTHSWTKDNVFILSSNEIKKYFSNEEKTKCSATEFAVMNGVFTRDKQCIWCLRSPSDKDCNWKYVSCEGRVEAISGPTSSSVGVRPAIWIRLQ